MARTKGATDLKKRKVRRDKGRKRKRYAGREIVRFKKKKGRKTELKLYIWKKEKMSHDGYRRWNRNVRSRIRPIIYKPQLRVDVPVDQLSNKGVIEKWAVEIIGYEGEFLVMGYSGSLRSKTGVKPVKLCRLVLTNHPEGIRAQMTNNYRLFRYWFWRGK